MELKPVNVNGYDTCYIESVDEIGKHLLIYIPKDASKDISNICGQIICGHLIQQIAYAKVDGKIVGFKAYY